MAAMREEMRAGFVATREEAAGIRTELIANRAETLAFHRQVLYVVVTLWVGLLGLLANQLSSRESASRPSPARPP
jgi:hypothetical protein